MGPNAEDVSELLIPAHQSICISRWMEDETWRSIRDSLNAVRNSRELLAQNGRDLLRFQSLGCTEDEDQEKEDAEKP